MKEMLIGLIPEGRENAVTREYLCSMTGLSDREVRKTIEGLRNDGFFICNDGDGWGYYISNDINQLTRQYRNDTARAMAILRRRKHIRTYLKERGIKV